MTFSRKRHWRLFCLPLLFLLFMPPLPAAAQGRNVIRVGYPLQDGFTMKDGDGRYSGYTYDYLQELSQHTGWKYEYVEVDGALNDVLLRMLEMLKDGEIDLLGGMAYSESLKGVYDYAGNSYGNTSLSLVVPDDNTALTSANYTDQGPLRVAVIGSGSQLKRLEEYGEEIGLELIIENCEDSQMQERLLAEGQAEAMLCVDVGVPSGFRTIAKFSPTPFYLATTKGNKELLRQLNAGMLALEEDNPSLKEQLYEKYFLKPSAHIIFTEEEQEYLDHAETLTVAVLDGKMPIQGVDSETGEATGISREVFNYISQQTGLRFEYICLSDPEEYRRLLLEDQVDLAAAVPHSISVSEEFEFLYSLSYLNVTPVLIFHKGLDPSRLDGMTYALYDTFGEPDSRAGKVVVCPSVGEALEAVEEGRADYSYINNLAFQSAMNWGRFSHISVVAAPDSRQQLISIGITDREAVVLNGIINKVIAYLPASEMRTILYENSISREKVSFRQLMRENPTYVMGAVLAVLFAVFGGVLWNLSSKYRLTQKMALENERYRQLSEVVGECIFEYNYRTDQISFSLEGIKAFGLQAKILDYSRFSERKRLELEAADKCLYQWLREEAEGTGEIHLLSSRDPKRWYRVTSKVIRSAHGSPVYAIGRIWDIQEELEEKERLMELAQKDGLTGLYNAATIKEMIGEALKKQSEGGAFLILDIDRFKEINDQFGHMAGDEVLIQVSACMREVFGETGLVGRLGGDEFVAFFPEASGEDAVLDKVGMFRERLSFATVSEEWTGVTVSVGIIIREREQDFAELYRKADELLYEVKRQGKNGFLVGPCSGRNI